MRVLSPLPALPAVNQLSLLVKAMLQRSLYSQNYVVIFSFPVHFSEAEIISWAQWEGSNTCCDSVAIFMQIPCLRDFKITSAAGARKRLFFFFFKSFSWCCKQYFVKSPCPSPVLPHVGQQGFLAGVVPLCKHTSNERKGDILCCDSPIEQW